MRRINNITTQTRAADTPQQTPTITADALIEQLRTLTVRFRALPR